MEEGTLILTVAEAAHELRRSAKTVRRLIRAGRIKAIRIPPSQMLGVRRTDLVEFVRNLETTQQRGDRLVRFERRRA